jgi:hypothetical protein
MTVAVPPKDDNSTFPRVRRERGLDRGEADAIAVEARRSTDHDEMVFGRRRKNPAGRSSSRNYQWVGSTLTTF